MISDPTTEEIIKFNRKKNRETMDESRHIKKESILKALEKSLGVVTVACKSADVPRSTYYKWLNEDEEFAKQVQDIENIALDFGESQLHKQIGDGSTSATIFFLKTKGKRRGYVEKSELDITSGDKVINMPVITFVETETE